jgi:hypothetical protein
VDVGSAFNGLQQQFRPVRVARMISLDVFNTATPSGLVVSLREIEALIFLVTCALFRDITSSSWRPIKTLKFSTYYGWYSVIQGPLPGRSSTRGDLNFPVL